MAATSLYYNLAKLGRVQLPSGNEYALIDYNGRELIAPIFSTEASYESGDYVLYSADGYGSELFRFTSDHTAGAWIGTDVEKVNVGSELKRIESAVIGGIHYRGKTTTPLYDFATTNPITINSSSYTAEQGDMVIFDRANSSSVVNYATNTAYSAHTYLKNDNLYYITTEAITAGENTSFTAIRNKVDAVKGDPEFLFDGTLWNELGGDADAFGALAYKDSASGSYTAPTGSGSVTVKEYTPDKKKLSTTTILGVADTVGVSKMTAGTAIAVASAGTAVRYGTADVGASVTYGTANKAASATTVGNANVGTAVVYGTANVGSGVSVATAGTQVVYGTADVGSEVVYGTANPGTTITGVAKLGASQTFTTAGITCAASGDLLTFSAAGTSSIYGVDSTSISITPAVLSTTKLTPAKAADTTRKLTPVGGTTTITPAVAAPSSQTITPAVQSTTSIYGAVDSTSTLTPAVAAPNNQTIVPAVSNGTIVPWTESAKTVAVAASSSITVATGSLEAGNDIVTGCTATDVTKQVTVGTTSGTVTVQ